MGTIPPEMGEPYRAIMRRDWKTVIEFYRRHTEKVLFPMTARGDTALHMAVFSNKKRPVEELLEIIQGFPVVLEENEVMLKNAFGMTALHEAATCGNFEAVRLLVTAYPQLLGVKSEYGETALFRAAVFGHTQVVDFLASQPGTKDQNGKLLECHRVRADSTSILHVAIQGEHYDTALFLLNMDESIGQSKDCRGITALHLLASVPSAFKSGCSMSLRKRFIYYCLPVDDDECRKFQHNYSVPIGRRRGADGGQRGNRSEPSDKLNISKRSEMKYLNSRIVILKLTRSLFADIYLSVCKFLFTGWPMIERIWDEKKKHVTVLILVKRLIKKDVSLNEAMTVVDVSKVSIECFNPLKPGEDGLGDDVQETTIKNDKTQEASKIFTACFTAPLLIATSRGIIEIVREILREYPQAVEYHNHMALNIFHVAVMHRRTEIFRLVRRMRIPMTRINHAIDLRGYTLLHHVADIKYYTGGNSPGPALKLQEELQWFERVRRVVPSHYIMHCDRYHKKPPWELFKEQHKSQLQEAQAWIKETSQSCSAVAVLVATVVFAAVYTVPGGSNDKGVPIFLHSPSFFFFTIMDVMALASSLTSVVMFLSILTSPFEFEDFLHSLPRKLTFGFTLLFFSVLTTMLAFAATILLVIRTEKQWTTSLIAIAAFLPISVFVLMQFHLYVAFMATVKSFLRSAGNGVPWFLVPWRKRRMIRTKSRPT